MKSEKAIQNETLMGVTALPEVMAWRENSAMSWAGRQMKVAVGQTVRIRPGMVLLEDARPIRAGVPGIGDIMGVAGGRAFALEIKDEDGKQEISQVRFERAFTAAGGAYAVVRDADRAVEFLRKTVLGQ